VLQARKVATITSKTDCGVRRLAGWAGWQALVTVAGPGGPAGLRGVDR
jgi:hypothetical protein